MYVAGQSNLEYSQDQNSCLYAQLVDWSSLRVGSRVTLLIFLQKPFTNPAGHVHLLCTSVWHSVQSAALPLAFSMVRISDRDDPRVPSEKCLSCPAPMVVVVMKLISKLIWYLGSVLEQFRSQYFLSYHAGTLPLPSLSMSFVLLCNETGKNLGRCIVAL